MHIDKLVFVILDGAYKNLAMASIKFNRFGAHTQHAIIECSDWGSGFTQAQTAGYSHAIFMTSSTVFYNLDEFIALLDNYPHEGLIGHIIDPLDADKPYALHPQCFLLELSQFSADDFAVTDFESVVPIRSQDNIHHDYTPLWLRPSKHTKHYTGTQFGERLIAKQMSRGIVVNWKHVLREYKQHIYQHEDSIKFLAQQEEYVNLAQNQLWVFNNEPVNITSQHQRIVCPASGLYWMLQLITDVVQIDLVDISRPQLQLAQSLLDTWDGTNYGEFVFDFMRQHNIKHYCLQTPNMTKEDRVKLMRPSVFISTVNAVFDQQVPADFVPQWQRAKSKTVNMYNMDMIDFLKTATGEFDVWISNILDYKYTMLRHSIEELRQYEHLAKSK